MPRAAGERRRQKPAGPTKNGEPFGSPFESGRRDLNPRPPEPHSGALPDCATSRNTRRQGAEMPRRRGKASPPDPTPSPKDSRGKTSPLISHIHSAARRLGVYLHVSASRPSKPSAA